jgi:hypothetical protein
MVLLALKLRVSEVHLVAVLPSKSNAVGPYMGLALLTSALLQPQGIRGVSLAVVACQSPDMAELLNRLLKTLSWMGKVCSKVPLELCFFGLNAIRAQGTLSLKVRSVLIAPRQYLPNWLSVLWLLLDPI